MWQKVKMTKRLHHLEAFEQKAGAPRPIVALEDDIAVEPHDLAAAVRQRVQSDVQQPFLLPQDVLAAQTNEDFCIIAVQLEIVSICELDRDKWNDQALAK